MNTITDFKTLYEQNKKNVKLKATSNPDLFVLKYDRKVFYKNLWNDFLEECRGTVVDKDFNIVSLPFRKIYNFGVEDKAPKIRDDETIHWFRKINGFMVAMTWYNDDVLVSTTGSIDSDFVQIAKKYLTDDIRNAIKMYHGCTFMFECCDPSDPHIVHEEPGLYLIGIRRISDGVLLTELYSNLGALIAINMNVFFPESGICTMGELRKMVKGVDHEGFVIYTEDGRSTKIKSKHYLIKKMFMRGNVEKLLDNNAKGLVEEEFYPLCDAIKANREEFSALDEFQRREWIENFLDTQVNYES